MLTERTFLQGNKKERIYLALTKAGWFYGSASKYTHEYEDDVLKFDSIVQLIHNELLSHDLETVAMKP